MDIPEGIAAEQALLRQAVALSVIKQSADMDKAMVAILDQAIRSVPVSPVRGGNVSLSA
jgi:hypothetical protein